jgi:hypothetical protein
MKQENDSQLTFQPAVNPHAHPKYKRRGDNYHDDSGASPVFERLIVKGDTKNIMQNVLAKLKDELELKDCTFKPTLVPRNVHDNVQENGSR